MPKTGLSFWIGAPPTLVEAIDGHLVTTDLLLSLLQAIHPGKVFSVAVDGQEMIFTEVDSGSMVLKVAKGSVLEGAYSTSVQQAYMLAKGVEVDLSSATYLPGEMGEKRIAQFCSEHGVSLAQFRAFMNSWAKVRS